MYLPDVPVSFAFGAMIVASNLPRGNSGAVEGDELTEVRRRSFKQVLLFGLLVHCPDSFSAFIFYPDWNLGYFAPFSKVGYAGAALISASLLPVLLAGCFAALKAVERRKVLVWVPVGAGWAGFAVVFAAVWDRYLRVGDYTDYHAGRALLSSTHDGFQTFTAAAGAYLILPLVVLLVVNFLRTGNNAAEAAN